MKVRLGRRKTGERAMKKWLCRFVAAVCLLGVVGASAVAEEGGHAAGDAAHQPGEIMAFPLSAAVINLIIFVLVVVVLGKFVWPKVAAGLDARQEKIRGDIESAERANREAQATLASYEKKMSDAHAEARKLLEQARVDSEKVRQRMAGETEQELTKLRERAKAEIGQAKSQAVEELYGHAAKLSLLVAEKILKRTINEADTRGLVESSLKEMDGVKG